MEGLPTSKFHSLSKHHIFLHCFFPFIMRSNFFEGSWFKICRKNQFTIIRNIHINRWIRVIYITSIFRVEFLVLVFPISSGWTLSSVFVSHFGWPFWDDLGYSVDRDGDESKFSLPIMSITSLKILPWSTARASCVGESASEGNPIDWSSIGILPSYVESHYKTPKHTLYVWIYPSD